MKAMVKHLWLALTLIAVASSILLLSDMQRRRGAKTAYSTAAVTEQHVAGTEQQGRGKTLSPEAGKTYRISMGYMVPAPIFDYAIQGFRDEMTQLGFIEGKNLELQLQHANGDMSFLPQVIMSMVQSASDLLVMMSTPCLASAIAHADGVNIAFGIVSAPLEAGAGESFTQHLPHVTGIAQQIPTEELFDWAQRLLPHTQRIGALYNPSEANSAKEIVDLKRILDARGIALEQVAVYTTSEVPEGIRSLLNRNVDMVFAMADNTVANGMPAMIKVCRQYNVPMIADDVGLMGTGALISCSSGPYSDGRSLARLSARLLLKENPASIPIAYGEKMELGLDLTALQRAGITPSTELLKRADVFFNLRKAGEPPMEVALVNIVNTASLDAAIAGLWDGLAQMGLKQERDYVVRMYNAQGDMTQVSQILDQVAQQQPDVLITVSTPVFVAAAKRNFNFPLVFTVASDPAKLGLFLKGCPPNITGVHDDPPVDAVLQMARRHDPVLTAVGIVYNPAEMNSMLSVKKLRIAGREQNVEILESSVSTASDLPMATQALIQRGARGIILSADNLATGGFAAIHKVAKGADIPVYTTDTSLMQHGASGAIGDSYFAWGRQSGQLAARVLAGVSPADLPIGPTQVYDHFEPGERKQNVALPPELSPGSKVNEDRI
ncbi:MAG: ABC transporter substrate-binding protein [Desulfuromonadaceae bacterium]|nr:ABC transporter substrate-binding protein [Desulfuromonadaceae bacterium]